MPLGEGGGPVRVHHTPTIIYIFSMTFYFSGIPSTTWLFIFVFDFRRFGSVAGTLLFVFAVFICYSRSRLPDGVPKPSICETIKVRKCEWERKNNATATFFG